MEGFPIRVWGPIVPGWRWLYFRVPANQRSAAGAWVSTPFGRFFYVWKGIVVCGLLGWQGGKRCKKMVMRLGDSCRVFPLLPERLEEMGTEGAAWKRCLRARILLRTLSFPEVFQHPVEYMAMERVIRGQGGMIEILGGIVEHPEPPHEAL